MKPHSLNCCGALFVAGAVWGFTWLSVRGAEPGVLTNAAEVYRVCSQPQNSLCTLRLEGTLLWTSPARDGFLLQTEAGCVPVEIDVRGQPGLGQGQRVRLEGTAVASNGRLRDSLVDNDGLHPTLEKGESVYLPAGRLPIQVAWFNGPAYFVLGLDYAPPGGTRQPIPEAVLWRAKPEGGTNRWVHGLDYHCYEGNWERLPDFHTLAAVKSGTTPNFNLGVRSRDLQVGLQWRGYLEVRQAGLHRFWLQSDDGSRLQFGEVPLRVTPLGATVLPAPHIVELGQSVADGEWVQMDGVLTALRRCPSGGAEAELSLGAQRLYVEVAEEKGPVPKLFSRVRVRGAVRASRAGPGQERASRLLLESWQAVEVLAQAAEPAGQRLRQLAEVQRLGANGERAWCALEVQGLVLGTSPTGRWLALQDESGAALIEVRAPHPPLHAGQVVRLAGAAWVEGGHIRLEPEALVDNDRIHPLSERSGTIYLPAGKHPLHLSWFNAEAPAHLEVDYQGPGSVRQPLPAGALFHAEPQTDGTVRWAPGVAYCSYEGSWARLPDPGLLLPSTEGIATNLDAGLASRRAGAAVEFSGWMEAPQEGLYTFWVRSSDGSRLFVGEGTSGLEVVGEQAVARPARLVPCQSLRANQEGQWSQAEGTVSFASEQGEGLELELSSATGPMRVLVSEAGGLALRLLLKSRVRVAGLAQLTYTTDGQAVAGALLVPGRRQIEVMEVASERWNEYPVASLHRCLETNASSGAEGIVHFRGTLRAAGEEGAPVVEQGTERVRLGSARTGAQAEGVEVEALGRLVRTDEGAELAGGCYRVLAPPTETGAAALPLLTTIEQVKSLTRKEAERGYPVKIRGILTAPLMGGFFIQDSTWAIYVSWDESTNLTLHAGDYWEVEGKTFAEFAPNIDARRAVRLGAGTLPAPLRPTYDQLINGSLDTRYVEVQGIVTAVVGDHVNLLTRAGKNHLELPEAGPGSLRAYENALIRVRGCLMPGRNESTQEVELGRIQLLNYSLTVDEPAPPDPFGATFKRAADLLLFDSRAGAIQRVRLAGQVVESRRGEYFLLEGTNGLRFVPKGPVDLKPGDLAEVVGFPVLGGPSPVLREALVRRTGHAPLPAARPLAEEELLNRQHEANLVRVKGRLVNVSYNRAEQVLELQAGTRGFVARLEGRYGSWPELLPGSLLELTGVYAGQGGDATSGRGLDGFELLLSSPAATQVLARPSWWSLQHTLAVLGGMGLVLMAAVVWISLLRRQVEERSRQLAVAIHRQEHAESQRRLEQERARVARDLHDDLGAALTEIGLLGGLAQRLNTAPERVREHLAHITDKAREMVTTLDEIVWSLNPKHDSVASLSKYFCEYAQQFLQLTTVRCRLEVAEQLPDLPVSSEQRHHLLLAFKEALTNVVRHAQASETHIGIGVQQGVLVVTVSDDGRGWDGHARSLGADGLDNLAGRLRQLGGNCKVSSQPGRGTRVQMTLPVENPTDLGSGQP